MTTGVLHVSIRRKAYPRPDAAPVVAIAGLEFAVRPGEFLCVLGPSGCGKSTLLNLIAGLDLAFDGAITYAGGTRPPIGFVFQTPRLLPWRTARENIDLVMSPEDVAANTAERWLARMGLTGFEETHPERLSLGMQRRVALARAFAARPGLLLMDEPFVSIDAETAARLRALLMETWRADPVSVIFVTHDIAEAAALADSVLVLTPGPATLRAHVRSPLSVTDRGVAEEVERFRAHLTDVLNRPAPRHE